MSKKRFETYFKILKNIFRKGRNGRVKISRRHRPEVPARIGKDAWISFLLKCLLYHGLLDRVLKKRLSVKAWILLVVVNLYAGHSVCLWAYNTYRFSENETLLYQIVILTEVISVAYLVNATFLNGNLLSNCVRILRDANRFKSKRWFIKLYQVAFLVTNIGRMASYLIKPYSENETLADYVQFYFYDLHALKTNYALGAIVIRIDSFFYYYVTYILTFVYQSVVMFSADSLRISVSTLAVNLSSVDCDVREMCLDHGNLFATIQSLDGNVRVILCVWVLQWAINFYYFLLSFKNVEEYGYIEALYTFATIFSMLVLLLTMSLLSNSSGFLLKSCHLRYVKRTRLKSRKQLATEVFLLKLMRTGILHFTVFKSAILNPGFIRGISVAIISYASFVISTIDHDAIAGEENDNNVTQNDVL